MAVEHSRDFMFIALLLSFWIHYWVLACRLTSPNVVNVYPLKAHSVCTSNFNVRGYKIVRKKDDPHFSCINKFMETQALKNIYKLQHK